MRELQIYGRGYHGRGDPWSNASARELEFREMMRYMIERLDTMATQAQLDKLKADIAALIQAGVDEINAAVAAAQNQSADPAIDTLDTQVTAATQALTDAAAKLKLPPAS